MANRTTPSRPLSGAQRRCLRVAAGLPRYTPAEESARRERDRKRDVLRLKRNQDLVSRIKLERGCVMCGYRDHPAALEFHHRDPAEKRDTVARLVFIVRNVNTLLDEIAKCEVLCANCHRIVTHGGAL